MKLRCVIGLLFLCSTIAAFGQQGASHGSWIGHLFGYGFLFQVAAVIHWSRKRPEAFWLWIIIIGGWSKLQGLKPHGDFNSAYWNANEWTVTA